MNPFYGLIVRNARLVLIESGPAMAIANMNVGLALCVNYTHFKQWDDDHLFTILKHECLHVLFGHMNPALVELMPHRDLRNIAMDLEINCHLSKKHTIDLEGCYPGEAPFQDLPPGQDALFYYTKLRQMVSEQADDLLEMLRQMLLQAGLEDAQACKVKAQRVIDMIQPNHLVLSPEQLEELYRISQRILNASVVEADKRNSWGDSSSELKKKLGMLRASEVHWAPHLRSLLGRVRSDKVETSRRKVNKRFGTMYPGMRREHQCQFTVLQVDTEVSDPVKFRVGEEVTTKLDTRQHTGGTDFNAPAKFFNEHLADYDMLVMVTDGECAKPMPVGKRRMWVLPQGASDHVTNGEPVIFV
jgi:predicted metal-dependent peptidase